MRKESKNLKVANHTEYTDFIAEYLKAGGKIDHSYGIVQDVFMDFNGGAYGNGIRRGPSLFIAKEDCVIPNEYGSRAMTIIVPRGKTVTTGGHNNILDLNAPLTAKNMRASRVRVDKRIAHRLKRDHGITLKESHFTKPNERMRTKQLRDEFLWQIDRVNGVNLIERFKNAHDQGRLTAPIVLTRGRKLAHKLFC